MSRLIDADELKQAVCKTCDLSASHLCEKEGDVKGCFVELINKAPTVDAVQVVRCKECKHSYLTKSSVRICDNPRSKYWYQKVVYDNFCKYGERKKENAL